MAARSLVGAVDGQNVRDKRPNNITTAPQPLASSVFEQPAYDHVHR